MARKPLIPYNEKERGAAVSAARTELTEAETASATFWFSLHIA